jgi:hypothetical protein
VLAQNWRSRSAGVKTGSVFKLIKLFIGLLGLGAFAWLGLTVPLGERTLFGHLSAIGQSKESQQLVRGTKEKVGDLKKRIAGEESATAAKAAEPAGPQERLSKDDRKEIRHFIDTARAKVSKPN